MKINGSVAQVAGQPLPRPDMPEAGQPAAAKVYEAVRAPRQPSPSPA